MTIDTFLAERNFRIAELEAQIAAVQALLPGPPTFLDSLARDFQGNQFPRTMNADKVAAALAGPADILDSVKRDVAFDTIEGIRADLAKPGILWHGDGGVKVMVDPAWNRIIPLDQWLKERADSLDI